MSLATKFNEYFTSVGIVQKAHDLADKHNFCIEPTTTVRESTLICDESDDLFQFCTVLEEQVDKIIKAFPSNKAPGPDKVSARVLKDSLPVTLSTITSIMNVSFCSNTFAKAWKTAEVSPVLKSGVLKSPVTLGLFSYCRHYLN